MKLRTIWLIVSFALGLLAAPLPAAADQAGKIPRIGVLCAVSCTGPLIEALPRGLRELGYVEGDNVAIEYRWAKGKYERLPTLTAELVQLKVDVIVAVSTPVTRAAVNTTKTIPIVFTLVGDPVGSGFVVSLAQPGGNVTGLSTLAVGITPKWLELLKETVPKLSRVAVLWNPVSSFGALALRETEVAAQALGVQLQVLPVRSASEFDSAFASMSRERADALLVLPDALFFFHRARLAKLAAKSRLPAMHGIGQHVEAGDLMAYAANLGDLVRRAATFVDKILKGANPTDLPVEQPTKFDLIINLKTAKVLGITIPDSILIRATKVIE